MDKKQIEALREAFQRNWLDQAGPCDEGYWFRMDKTYPDRYASTEMQQDWEAWCHCFEHVWKIVGPLLEDLPKIRVVLRQLSRMCNASGFDLPDNSIAQKHWYGLRDEANWAIYALDAALALQKEKQQ